MAADNLVVKPEKIKNSSMFGHFCTHPPACCEETIRRDAEIIAHLQKPKEQK